MKYLIAGLGNIGREYELTRHNVGFLVLDQLADKFDGDFKLDKQGSRCEIKHKGRSLHLLKPTTYMNLSGKAVQYWLSQLKLSKDKLLVVTDDIALPFGKLRIRLKGSNAGHNGLKNIEDVTGGNDYPRLKFGIGDNFHKGQQVDYVLSNFNQQEMNDLKVYLDKAVDMILSFSTIGAQRTMNQYND
ncbi:MAG TPA: aminoacyl-tRNA hydrolase [Cyclobacteriaceae bacterium]